MRRGSSFGGGKSSLSYLFEPEETNQGMPNSKAKQSQQSHAKSHETDEAKQTGAFMAPQTEENSKTKVEQEGKPQKHANNQNAIHFYAGRTRPSTKVNSVPGGRSSLGYLFGDS